MRGKKGRNYISQQACFAIHETGLSWNVVASLFPLIIFILFCFKVLSTVPRENRLEDFLYIYININELLIELSLVNMGNELVSSYLHRNKALLRNSWTKYLNLPPHLLCKFYSVSSMVTNILSIKIPWRMIWSRNRLVEKNLGLCFFSLAQFISRCTSMHQAL